MALQVAGEPVLRDRGVLSASGLCAPPLPLFYPLVQGASGWNMVRALESIDRVAPGASTSGCGDHGDVVAARAVQERLQQYGWNYFRLHPKGRGVVCRRSLPAFTFVEEYLGQIHTPWRWFEIQVGPRKLRDYDICRSHCIACWCRRIVRHGHILS